VLSLGPHRAQGSGWSIWRGEQESGSDEAITGRDEEHLEDLLACVQSTPEVPLKELMIWLATPTPMMEPTNGVQLEAGDQAPGAQVSQDAAMRSANTMEYPAPELTLRMKLDREQVMTLKATAPEDMRTAGASCKEPDQMTACSESRECV